MKHSLENLLKSDLTRQHGNPFVERVFFLSSSEVLSLKIVEKY
jgi:hypothetical protein